MSLDSGELVFVAAIAVRPAKKSTPTVDPLGVLLVGGVNDDVSASTDDTVSSGLAAPVPFVALLSAGNCGQATRPATMQTNRIGGGRQAVCGTAGNAMPQTTTMNALTARMITTQKTQGNSL